MDRRKFIKNLGIIGTSLVTAPSFSFIEEYFVSDIPEVPEDLSKITNQLIEINPELFKIIEPYIYNNNFELHNNIIERFNKAPEKKKKNSEGKKFTYEDYKKLLNLEGKKKDAPLFLEFNFDKLLIAEKKYEVDASYIAAILGVESHYGTFKGKYKAFNALTSLLFTKKSGYAKNQLKSLVRITKNNNIFMFDLYSSYAGATTHAQFIPTSIEAYFKSADPKRDFEPYNLEDCMHSIANYLGEHRWKYGKTPYLRNRNGRAIKAYNRSTLYYRAVKELGQEFKQLINN